MRIKNFNRLAICNRGEVAVRIIEAGRALGLKTLLLHSPADRQTRAYRMADECICLQGDNPYLDIDENLRALRACGAEAVHPGFGFLSENADFAEAVVAAGLVFVGPYPDAIRKMGDKIEAKKLMEQAQVPCIPGYKGEDQSYDELLRQAKSIGFPVLIKAAAGGGGRGMKVAETAEDFAEKWQSARREALAAFGSDKVFLEKYLRDTKHIEFQILGDSYGNYVHLFERECSIQRRHQKIIEEAPSPSLTPELRSRMAAAAIRAAESVNYVGAGTVEFLLAGQEFFFLEMNTRLQVEHPVTEQVTGIDLVQTQIRIARGEPLAFSQSQIALYGHSIECRLYAEDPYQGGRPSTGEILWQKFPLAAGRRFEYAFDTGDSVTSLYDPMIAKLIVHQPDRGSAMADMIDLIRNTQIFGIHSNLDFLAAILSHEDFTSGRMTTGFIEQYFAKALGERVWTETQKKLVDQLLVELAQQYQEPSKQVQPSLWLDAWRGI